MGEERQFYLAEQFQMPQAIYGDVLSLSPQGEPHSPTLLSAE
jgi:hypothetical protein